MTRLRLGCIALLILFAGNTYAQTLHLKTENYPPFNLEGENGEIIGASTEIVELLFERAGVNYDLELLPWQRAYNDALEKDNHGVFSTTRTAEREPLFKWVGPVMENNWVFLKKASRDIEINSLEEAKQYRVGGYYGDAVSVYLESQGFTINYVPSDYLNARKIERDRIDLWATGQLLGPWYARANGVRGLEEAMTFRETIMSIAFNRNVDDAVIDHLNAELQLMIDEGIIGEIKAKYK